jgi:hypothetical protein
VLAALTEAAPALKPQIREAEWVGNRRWNLTFRTGQVLALPEGTFRSAYGIPGESTFKKIGLVTGRWYQFVVENVGTKWTLWVDGKETLSLNLKRSDVEKESVNFIGFGPFLLDDILIEELPR